MVGEDDGSLCRCGDSCGVVDGDIEDAEEDGEDLCDLTRAEKRKPFLCTNQQLDECDWI